MYDTLTLDQLYDLHSKLSDEHTTFHHRLIGPDHQPIVNPLSAEWDILDAKAREVAETMTAVHAVILVREAERTNA